MLGKGVSENGNSVSEDEMTSAALKESRQWYDELMKAEFRGRGDREKSARGRLADNLGIPEKWLFDLQYKSAEKKDVRGALYRALLLGRQKYDALCIANEEAAERHRAERLGMRERHAKADKEHLEAARRENSADH